MCFTISLGVSARRVSLPAQPVLGLLAESFRGFEASVLTIRPDVREPRPYQTAPRKYQTRKQIP
jgi:hypothetical protein